MTINLKQQLLTEYVTTRLNKSQQFDLLIKIVTSIEKRKQLIALFELFTGAIISLSKSITHTSLTLHHKPILNLTIT
jgi:hypothetical protein